MSDKYIDMEGRELDIGDIVLVAVNNKKITKAKILGPHDYYRIEIITMPGNRRIERHSEDCYLIVKGSDV